MDSTYVPGVCNIGHPTVARRRAAGITGVTLALLGLAVAVALHAPRPTRLLLALPATAGAAGLIQARTGFCASLGLRGLHAAHDTPHARTPVTDLEHRHADQRTARRILTRSAAAGIAAALATTALPR